MMTGSRYKHLNTLRQNEDSKIMGEFCEKKYGPVNSSIKTASK